MKRWHVYLLAGTVGAFITAACLITGLPPIMGIALSGVIGFTLGKLTEDYIL
jgi:hypothetical protein